MSYTFSIIKPDSVRDGFSDQIIARINSNKFKVISIKLITLDKHTAQEFYAVHKTKDFYDNLIAFMTSGPCIVLALEKSNAVENFRELIGDTDPAKAELGTIRSLFGKSIENNAIHGADSDQNAKKEILFFFPELVNLFK